MEFVEFLKNYGMYIVVIPLLLTVIIVMGLLMNDTFNLKSAYEYGNALQKECNDSFMERERGDYHAYIQYMKSTENMFKTTFQIFASLFIVTCGVLFIIAVLIYGTMIVERKTYFIKSRAIIGHGLSALIIFTIYIVVITQWSWSLANKYTDKTIVSLGNISPLAALYNKDNRGFIGSQMWSFLFSLAAVIGLYILVEGIFKESYSAILQQVLILLGVIIAILFVFIPLISSYIFDVRVPMDTYKENYTNLNTYLTPQLTNATVLSKLKENLYVSTGNTTKDFTKQDHFKDETGVTDSRFSFISHYPNYSDLQLINIPNELRPYIFYKYLQGESVMEVKRALSKFYNDKNRIPFDLTNNKAANNYYGDISLQASSDSKNLTANIIPYLTAEMRDIMFSTNITDADDLTKKEDFLKVLNDHVILNDMFSKASPFSTTIYNKLQEMRQDKSIEQTVTGVNTVVKSLVYFILFSIVYIFYHNAYKNFPEKTLQISTIIVISLLLLGVAGGYFTKDLWL